MAKKCGCKGKGKGKRKEKTKANVTKGWYQENKV